MPDAEDPKQVNNNDLRNAQFAGGFVNADKVIAGQIGDDNYNIYIGQPSQQRIDIDWHQVSSSLLDEHLRLTTNPLTFGEGITYRTEQVYVPLGLVERKKQSRRKEDVLPEKGSELYQETEITQTLEHQQFLEQVLRDRQSPRSQGRRIAIIGEPGAGKTTLLQQIAQWVSKEIEQSVIIWVSLADLRSHDLESYLLEIWLQTVARKIGQAEASIQVKDDFVAQFNQGLVWLVLDGVDEMQSTLGNPLEEIGQQIRQGSLLQQARIVLSCRLNLWDGGSNALNFFDNYRTLEFSYPQQVEQFISNWFGCISSIEIQTGQRLCAALRESGKERIRDLIKNPLRLTLLCFNWHLGEGNLPQTKAGLYEQFVADFYEWKKEQFATTREQIRRLNTALGEMAREAIDKEATPFRLRQEFLCNYLGEPDDANSLFAMALRLGWLNKVGVSADNPKKAVYAFFHPTFQEYFAALAINDWNYFLNHLIEKPNDPEASYRIFEPQWKEVILLWIGFPESEVSRKQKEEFIYALVKFNDKCKNFYSYRSLFLAVRSLAEFSSFSATYQVVALFISLCCITNISLVEEEAKKILLATDRDAAIFSLTFISIAGNSIYVRYQAADLLGAVDSGNKIAISTLTDLIHDTENDSFKVALANRLAEICPDNLVVLNTLLHLSQAAQDVSIRSFSIECLQKNTQHQQLIIPHFIQIIKESIDERYILQAVNLLGEIGYGNEKVIEALICLAIDEKSKSINWEISDKLGKIGHKNEKAINIIESYLKTTNEQIKIISLIYCLGEVGKGTQRAINILSDLADTSDSETIQLEAAYKLGTIDPGNQKAIDTLEHLVKTSKDENTSNEAALCLAYIDSGNEIAISFFLHTIAADNDKDSVSIALERISEIGQGNQKAICTLKKLICSTEDELILLRCAEALGQIDEGSKVANEVLLQLIKTTKDKEISKEASKNLIFFGQDNQLAINTLIEIVKINKDNDNCRFIIQILGDLRLKNSQVIFALIQIVETSQNQNIIIEAVRSLEKLMSDSQWTDFLYLFWKGLDKALEQETLERVECWYKLIWQAAQIMSYPEFYQATFSQK